MRFPSCRGVALAFVLSVSACTQSGTDPDGPMSSQMVRAASISGDAAAAAGAGAAAAGLFERAWRASPSPGVAVKWGRALRQSGDAKAATLAMQEAARRFPSDASVQAELGRAATAGGYSQEAAAAFERATSARGAGWDAFMAKGAFLAQQGRDQEAEASFRRAEGLAASDRDRYSAQANRALLRATLGDHAGAISDLEAIVRHPDVDPRVHADLALLHALGGNTDAFAREIRQAMLTPEETSGVARWVAAGAPGSPVAGSPAPGGRSRRGR